jgi:uncharacterized membrane protein HdeD (DUF308 family)
MGVLGIIAGISGGGFGSFLLGIASLLIGALLLGAPMTTALAVPFVFGILLLIEGVALIVYAFRVKGCGAIGHASWQVRRARQCARG